MLYKVIKIPKWTPRFILKMLFGKDVDYSGESFNGDCVVPDGCTLIQNQNKVFSNVFLGNVAVFDRNGNKITINETLDATGEFCEFIDSKSGGMNFTFRYIK